MAKIKVYDMTGKEVGEVELNPKIFNVEIKPMLVQQSVRTQKANSRIALAHTKDRSEVRGGGRKPWRQKGTGRARHGSIRSPIWKGGGVTFGPKKINNFTLKLNKKSRRKALLMALSDKASNKKIIVLNKLELAKIKSKDFAKMISKLPLKKKVLTVLSKPDNNIIKSSRNLPEVTTIQADSLNTVDILSNEYLLIPKDSLTIISKTYLK